MENWYSYVERFVGVSGNKDGLEILPDGEFLKPWESNVVEQYFSNQVKKNYKVCILCEIPPYPLNVRSVFIIYIYMGLRDTFRHID